MRLLLAATLALLLGDWLLTRTPTWCDLAGHNPHWTACGQVRECARCGTVWLRAQEPIGYTTSSRDPTDGQTESW